MPDFFEALNIKWIRYSYNWGCCPQLRQTMVSVPSFKKIFWGDAWVAQSVKRLTSAQIMILWLMRSSSAMGELEPHFRWTLLLSLSLCPMWDLRSLSPPLIHLCPLSQKKKKKKKDVHIRGTLMKRIWELSVLSWQLFNIFKLIPQLKFY